MVKLRHEIGAVEVRGKDLRGILENDICIQAGAAVDRSDRPTAECNFLLNKHCLFESFYTSSQR